MISSSCYELYPVIFIFLPFAESSIVVYPPSF